MIRELQKETKSLKDPKKAKNLQRFFKTGKGEYGEGDIFYGITVPESRKLVKKYKEMSLSEVQKLIKSKIHEERLIALLIFVEQFVHLHQGSGETRKKIFNLYLKNTRYINNWDLVDLSAHKIIGEYLKDKDRNILYKLAKSKSLWERRIAMISTFAFINQKDSKDVLKIARILLKDKHDLIHKAVGWGLREVGKRVSLKDEYQFLDKYAAKMPRTMLRYAIERFDEKTRQRYLQIK